jgi:DNA helicase II / ATP-dependent DNA helicase PcrA
MYVEIKITNKDVVCAENVLLLEDQHFDDERKDFIKNLDTIDLQAVPGSGKTTALLAKLLILEKHFPFGDGSGVLVISHTNAAIDEIKSKIERFCPKLFSYPNFVGTIQSFVDDFLAIPYYLNHFKKRPYRIDDEIYNETIDRLFSWSIATFTTQEQKNARYFLMGRNCKYSFRLGFDNGHFILLDKLNGNKLKIEKPKRGRKWIDFNDYEKNKIENWLIAFKIKVLKDFGVLHFDDAYFLSSLYFNEFPNIKKLLQKRFRYIFVDEMQDMAKHQYDLLEKVFFDRGNSISMYQRIGDKNQAIFNGDITLDDIWKPRDKLLELKGSYRLTEKTANIVKPFGLNFIDIEGRFTSTNVAKIKPHVFVFDNPQSVLPEFTEIIKINELSDDKHPFCAIGWSADYKYFGKVKTDPDKSKFTVKCYYPDFEKDDHRPKEDYFCLENYLLYYDKDKKTLESVRKSILNALLRILRYENILNDNRNYTKKKLLFFLKENTEKQYENLKFLLYQWSINIIRGKKSEVYSELKNYISEFLSIFGKSIDKSKDFIETLENNGNVTSGSIKLKNGNIYEKDGIKIEVTTIHAVKGQTHTATLYLETFYQKKYETNRLLEQFRGSKFDSIKTYDKQTTKMAYVGLSRPTHLLCMAIHKDRFNEVDFKDKWEIIYLKENDSSMVH